MKLEQFPEWVSLVADDQPSSIPGGTGLTHPGPVPSGMPKGKPHPYPGTRCGFCRALSPGQPLQPPTKLLLSVGSQENQGNLHFLITCPPLPPPTHGPSPPGNQLNCSSSPRSKSRSFARKVLPLCPGSEQGQGQEHEQQWLHTQTPQIPLLLSRV